MGKDAEKHNNRGYAYLMSRDYSKAISDFDRAIELNPRYAQVYRNRGLAYSGLGDYNRAISDYNTAIELNPKYLWTYYNYRGLAYFGLEDCPMAISDYTKAIEFNPAYASAYRNRGQGYLCIGEFQKAQRDIETAEMLDMTLRQRIANYIKRMFSKL